MKYKHFKFSISLSLQIDECEGDTHGCHIYANCTNTPGSYTCRCRDGYTGDGYTCTRKFEFLEAFDYVVS